MKKSEREVVFNKFGGKCAYCGEELKKGWHVDHEQPVRRSYKTISGHYRNRATKQKVVNIKDLPNDWFKEYEWVQPKNVFDKFMNPENNVIDNMLPACASCNINKHGMDIEQFRSLIAGFIKHLNEVSTQYKLAKRYGLVQETEIKRPVFYFEEVYMEAQQE